MRWTTFCLIFLFPLSVLAQSGPGGVGATASNVLWLDADQGVTRTGAAVSVWNDLSGNNNHAVVPGSIPGAEPSFVPASINGYPSLDFDGVNDQLWVNDNASIDLTQWHFYLVLTADLQKNYNAWFTKGDDSNENFELLSYSDGNLHTPTAYTDGSRTFPSSAAGQVVTTAFNVFEYSYAPAFGRDVYKNATTIITDNENKTPRVNNWPLYIGNERSTAGRCMDGDLAEVIAFNTRLNAAQRIIVNNYLAAKYGIALGANDIYTQDDAANGHYDHQVAGIGRVNASNLQADGQGSGIVRINAATGLGNNEFLLWGHNNATLGAWGVGDLPAGVEGRLERVWRISERNTAGTLAVDVGAVDMTFDLTGLGNVDPSHLRLLVDSDQDNVFADESPLGGAFLVSGNLYRFAGVTALQDGVRFTIGTTNMSITPLPIELVFFDAAPLPDRTVALAWTTATEWDNDHFTVERSTDLQEWTSIVEVDAVGHSNAAIDYEALDDAPEPGVNYYRIRQTDLDGTSTASFVVVVELVETSELEVLVHPNPTTGILNVRSLGADDAELELDLMDGRGRLLRTAVMQGGTEAHSLDLQGLAPGIYLLKVGSGTLARTLRVQVVGH